MDAVPFLFHLLPSTASAFRMAPKRMAEQGPMSEKKRPLKKSKLPPTFFAALKDVSFMGWTAVVVSFCSWYMFVTPAWKIATIGISLCYYFTETLYTTVVDYKEDGGCD